MGINVFLIKTIKITKVTMEDNIFLIETLKLTKITINSKAILIETTPIQIQVYQISKITNKTPIENKGLKLGAPKMVYPYMYIYIYIYICAKEHSDSLTKMGQILSLRDDCNPSKA